MLSHFTTDLQLHLQARCSSIETCTLWKVKLEPAKTVEKGRLQIHIIKTTITMSVLFKHKNSGTNKLCPNDFPILKLTFLHLKIVE